MYRPRSAGARPLSRRPPTKTNQGPGLTQRMDPWPRRVETFHSFHHLKYKGNYGGGLIIWDKYLGNTLNTQYKNIY